MTPELRLVRGSGVFAFTGGQHGQEEGRQEAGLLMPRTSTTRRGNGAGWGGPAKGAGQPPGNKDAGRPKGMRPGEGARTVADLMIADGCREIAAQRWREILDDPTHPKHAEMVAKAADRMDGAPTQNIAVRDVDPNTLTDAELAAIAAGSGRAAAGAADSAE